MKILALDLGDSRIGVAVSDEMHIIANGLETYSRQNLSCDLMHIADLCSKHNVGEIVIGLPINMDGSEGERVQKSRQFGELLSKQLPDVKIEYIDERLTTISAERVLLEADVSREKRKKVIDKVASTIILQSYLDIKK